MRRTLIACHVEDNRSYILLSADPITVYCLYYELRSYYLLTPQVLTYVQTSQCRLPDPTREAIFEFERALLPPTGHEDAIYSRARSLGDVFRHPTSHVMQNLQYKSRKIVTVFKHNMCLISESLVEQQAPDIICCSLFWSHRHSRRERAALRKERL